MPDLSVPPGQSSDPDEVPGGADAPPVSESESVAPLPDQAPASETTAKIDDLDAAAAAVAIDLEALLAEREQFLDAYRRAQADFENYRKQAQKRQEEAVARELGGLVERLLPVLDACDAAAAQGAADAVEPIVSSLFGALEKEGLDRIDPKGAAFDPTVAEAVVHEPGEGGAQIVAGVMRVGYRWQGRLLRPALVKVTD